MKTYNFVLGIIVAIVAAYLGFLVFQIDSVSDYLQPFIVPMLACWYYLKKRNLNSYFFWFLAFFGSADLMGLFYYNLELSELSADIFYYLCNTLYILAYISLLVEVFKSLDIKRVINRFSVHILILIALDIYCIILVSNIAIESGALLNIFDYSMEFIYNGVIMALLTVCLINYLHRDSKKAMNLVMGTLCIVFSEVIQVAYHYVEEIFVLALAYNFLLIAAFVFYLIQDDMVHEVPKSFNQEIKEADA